MKKQCRRRHYPLINPIGMVLAGRSITPDLKRTVTQ